MKKSIIICIAVVFCLILCACSSDPNADVSKPLDLTGNWEEAGKVGAYQAGFINDTTIEIYWIMEDGTYALYWSGTYEKPNSAEDTYTWESINDKSRTSRALMASSADTKVFSYAKGKLSYEASAMGVTTTITLVPTEFDYSSLGTIAGSNETQVFQDLQLVDSGYAIVSHRDSNYVYYAVEISNPNPDTAVEFPTIEITARNDDGAILGVETQVLPGIAAGDSFLYGAYFFVEDELPTNVEISIARPDDYDYIPQAGADIIHSSDLAISNVSEFGESNKRYTGEVTNNSSIDLDSVCVCVIYKNGDEIIGGDATFVDSVNSGETKAFEISLRNSPIDYDSYEIVALQW